MPAQETAFRRQHAVLWPITGRNTYAEPTVGDPIEVVVRWIPTRKEAVDRQGNTIAIDAIVVTNRIIDIGSLMWLGRLAAWVGTGSAITPDDQLMQVINQTPTPDLKARATYYETHLMRFRQSLPT